MVAIATSELSFRVPPIDPGSGLGTVVQAVPLYCSVRVRMAPLLSWVWPTTQASVGDRTWMPFSLLPSVSRLGTLVMTHLVPARCRT